MIIGPPAAGKGTQGPRLAGELGIPHLSSGHLLRRSMDRGDPYRVRSLVMAGVKVPDGVVESLVVPALGPGFVLDGYPRTRTQAEWLDRMLGTIGTPLDAALELALDEETLVARMVLRAGAEKRSDDRPDVFLRRLAEFQADVSGLRSHYGARLIRVDAAGAPEDVYERIRSSLGLVPA